MEKRVADLESCVAHMKRASAKLHTRVSLVENNMKHGSKAFEEIEQMIKSTRKLILQVGGTIILGLTSTVAGLAIYILEKSP